MELHDFSVYDMFRRNARLFRHRVALQTGEEKISYAELGRRVDALAAGLAAAGIGPGDRIAALTKNRPEFLVLAGATAAIGAILVPINFRLSAAEIAHVLDDTSPAAIVAEPDYEPLVAELLAGRPELKRRYSFGPGGEGFAPLAALAGESPVVTGRAKAEDPFLILHTAAVLGKPRGAVISHRNLVACSLQAAAAIGLTHRDTYLNILPLFHIAGLMAALTVLHAGGRNLIVAKYDPIDAGRTIDREGVTFIGNFPPILSQLLDAQAAGECSLASLRHVIGIELPATVKRFEELGSGRFFLVYGQAETTGLTCLCANGERPGSAGRPGALVDLLIADDFGREAARGEPGEILIRGPLVFSGYWGEQELTAQTFRGGWHHTGDVGRLDEEGYLWFVGRKAEKELIKPGGENVYPAEVEKALLEHPAVLEVSVIGVPHPTFGEGVKAVCVLRPGMALQPQELIDFVAGRLARYKKPSFVDFVAALPRREDGSVDREQVKQRFG